MNEKHKNLKDMPHISHIVGIDEVGRGPLAGPVAIGVVVIPIEFNWNALPHVTDSKQLSYALREEIYKCATNLQEKNRLRFCVTTVGAPVIDQKGIVRSVALGLARGLQQLKVARESSYIKLDGLLRAPSSFKYQETIIRGDEREKAIGLASIVAKVERDRYMVKMARAYPEYAFEYNKGYGTPFHKRAIDTHGLCDLHRKSYCRFADRALVL